MKFTGRACRLILIATLAWLLAACGGGEPGPAQAAPRGAQAVPSGATAATALFEWAQRNYPALFPSARANQVSGPYIYRHYPETGNYAGLAGDAIYLLGPVSGNQLMSVGSISGYACTLWPESCATAPIPADPGGSYTAYATHGERFTLTLDFAQGSFSFAGLTFPGAFRSGSFAASGSERAWVINGAANQGFRYSRDVIVGSYDFGTGPRPFVAARIFASSFTQIAGTYNNLGVTTTATGAPDSAIYSSRIDPDGRLYICNSATVYAIGLCPAASVQVYQLSVNGETFTAAAASANVSGSFNFRVAMAGGDRLYLMGAVGSAVPGTRFFRIGVAESADFPTGTALGGTTEGEWGPASFSSTGYNSSGVGTSGQPVALSGALGGLGQIGPTGMRIFHGGRNAFAIQNTQVGVLVGARGGAAAGYMQIGGK